MCVPIEFIDLTLSNGMGKMFNTKLLTDPTSIDFQQKVCMRLNGIIVDMRLNKFGGEFAAKNCLLFDALVYRFGRSNRHQKFWKSALQIYAELKRINQRNILDQFVKFVKFFEQANYAYEPSTSAVCYLSCSLLERIMRLDRLRVYCCKAADGSMGFIQLGHMINFNLIIIGMASELATEAECHIRHLCSIYDKLAEWLCKFSNKFPLSSSELNLSSLNINIRQSSLNKPNLESVESILKLIETEENDGNYF